MIDPLPIEMPPKDGTRILLWGGAALDKKFPDRYDPAGTSATERASSDPATRAEGESSR